MNGDEACRHWDRPVNQRIGLAVNARRGFLGP